MEIVTCTEKHLPELFKLFEKVYAANPPLRTREQFDWQFLNSPWNSERQYTIFLGVQNSEITSFLGYLPIKFREKGLLHDGCWTQKFYSKDNSGAGVKLLHAVMSKFNNRFHVGLSSDSADLYSAYRIPLLRQFPRVAGFPSIESALQLFQNVRPEQASESCKKLSSLRADISVKEISRFDHQQEYLLSPKEGITGYIQRSGSYLNWRYFDIPEHNYRAILNNNNEFGIFRLEEVLGTNHKVCRLLEWTFAGDSIAPALGKIMSLLNREECALIDFFCTSQTIRDSLCNYGFIDQNQFTPPLPHLFRPMAYLGDIQMAVDLPPHLKKRTFPFHDWYMTKGDSDLDRIKI